MPHVVNRNLFPKKKNPVANMLFFLWLTKAVANIGAITPPSPVPPPKPKPKPNKKKKTYLLRTKDLMK